MPSLFPAADQRRKVSITRGDNDYEVGEDNSKFDRKEIKIHQYGQTEVVVGVFRHAESKFCANSAPS